MKIHQQFEVTTKKELRNAYNFFKEIWDDNYTLEDEINYFNRYGSTSSTFVCYTGRGLQLNNQMGGFEVIENPLNKATEPFEDEELLHKMGISVSGIKPINLEVDFEEIVREESTEKNEGINPQPHYDNSEGSLYLWCDKKELNPWEFDIIKRVMRCRKKGQFTEDLKKTKDLIDIYLREYEK